ncbi:hypothetical protein, partial [Lyngbya sp. CCY1209]|uniref:hypothetical protein n=1 Tax=Lyngbya sp. CCY1209 TaxID=2886103 RepID=UPI002D20C424
MDVTSNGKGSVVQLPRLTAFDGTDSSSPSFIWAVNQGTVKAQKLASLKEVDLYATNSQLNLSGIKTFSGTTDT